MSVELKIIGNPITSQGEHLVEANATLKNSGTENVRNVTVKVIDTDIFDDLMIRTTVGVSTILNVFGGYIKNMDDVSGNFPAGTEKAIQYWQYDVKADAPVNVHIVPTHFTYEVY